MSSAIWTHADFSEEIIKNDSIFDKTSSIRADILSGVVDITQIVENMAGVLTSKEVEHRKRGIKFFTKLLRELPEDFLTSKQVKFISKFYADRLKDNHSVVPAVLEGYLAIANMHHYDIDNCSEFLTTLFREVPCQSQVRQDRWNIYMIIKKLVEKDIDHMKSLGPDFVYGFITSIEGERDPRNLLFLFNFLPEFLKNIPVGHLVEEMFEVLSCYFPIDFHPSPDDPTAISREALSNALIPCLCAVPEFGEQCLVLLIEKLDSNLRSAKMDSLKLLFESCTNFKSESYCPFLRTLWASLHREAFHKTDNELRMVALEALFTLTAKLSTIANTDQSFENFIKGILITMQTAIAEATTVIQFTMATKLLLTTANASRNSAELISKSMIPAMLAYYELKSFPKLQLATLDFLGDIFEIAKNWELLNVLTKEINEIPQICLTAASNTSKEFQMAGFRIMIRVMDVLNSDLVVPFIDILLHNIQHSLDNDLLKISIEVVQAMGRKYPELIMDLVVRGHCDINVQNEAYLNKRLNLFCSLASIDEFTKVIIEDMLKCVTENTEKAPLIVEALNESISNNSLYTDYKVAQIESDHGLVDSVLKWLLQEIGSMSQDSLEHGYKLISNTISNLPTEKQCKLLATHTQNLMETCRTNEIHYLILESLYNSINQEIYNKDIEDIMNLSLKYSLQSENERVRRKACVLTAHFLNKAESGQRFELLYEMLKNYFVSCSRENEGLCPRLIHLYGWVCKALVLRGSELFSFWLQKIILALASPNYSSFGVKSIQLIMTDTPDCLTARQHCRISLLYNQRMFQSFSRISEKYHPSFVGTEVKQDYLLSWAYILCKTPKTILNNEVNRIVPLLVDSLSYDSKDLLQITTDVLTHFVQQKHGVVADSLQTLLPMLTGLTRYDTSMDVRIKSLKCLLEIANTYPTALLLPYKMDVLSELAPSLDDKKRLVRNVAVRARTRWYLVGAPGEDKSN